jgi:tetratricopeptide (TPR) repeat protein
MTTFPDIKSRWILLLWLVNGLFPSPVFSMTVPSNDDGAKELRLLIETGDYQEAIDWVEEEPGEYPLLEARVFREKGRLQDAIATLEKARDDEGADAHLLAALAGLQLETGRYAEAEANLTKALAIDGDHVEALTRMGLFQIDQGNRDQGQEQLRKVIQIYKDMSSEEAQKSPPEMFVWFGKACEGLQRFRDAYEVMYDSALYLDPKSAVAHTASGHALYSKYNYPDARSHFRDALEANPNLAEAMLGLARATWTDYAFPGERGEEVSKLLSRASRIWPDHPERWLLEGDIAFASENWRRAEECYRKVLEIQPKHQVAQGLLGSLLYAVARLDEFEALRSKVEKEHPAPALFYVTLAERLVDRFFYRESAEFSLKAIELDAGLPKSYAIFSINALRSGLEEEGKQKLEEAWNKDRYNIWVKNTRTLMKHIDENFITREEDGLVIRMKSDEGPYLMPYLMPLMKDARKSFEKDYQLEVYRPLTIEDFSSHAYFSARSIGLPGLAASGVCFGRLVTLTTPNALPGNWGAVAVHELAHVVTLQKARHRIPRWFGEGLSVFEEARRTPRWKRHEPLMVSTEFHAGALRPIADLQKSFMNPSWPGEILVGYVQGGLICEMIHEQHGMGKINEMLEAYANGHDTRKVLRDVLGISASRFDRLFMEWLGKRIQIAGVGPAFQGRHIDRLRERTEDEPDVARHWVWLASAYLAEKKIADAELAMGKAEKLDPDSADLAVVRASLQLNEGLTDQALESLSKAIVGDSIWSWRSRLLKANLLRQRGETEAALKLMEEATAQAPTATTSPVGRMSPWLQLATLQKDLNLNEQALESYRQQIQYDRDDATTRLALAQSMDKAGDWQGVIDAAWDLPFITPYGDDGHAVLARAYLEMGDWQNARRELELRLAMENPQIAEIYPDLAWVLWKLGDNADALKWARRALMLDPASIRARQVVDALGE